MKARLETSHARRRRGDGSPDNPAPGNGAVYVIGDHVRVPLWVRDLASFRRWARSDDFPEHGWFSHLNGELWVDVSMETVAHNQLKTEFSRVLSNLVKAERLGRYFSDRMLLTNAAVALSTEPDGMFVSHEALRGGRVALREGNDTLEVEGAPDMTLEIVSRYSVRKDTIVLPDLYWRARVAEYWRVDSRGAAPSLEIFRRAARKYVPARPQRGWVKSAVFGRSFRLDCQANAHGLAEYTLEVA
ncbi:MAG: Uma2 family endonuclease [Gemmataceae bacterium]|nr:Uma2 family endonuclease [Gemmataceae bacterium]